MPQEGPDGQLMYLPIEAYLTIGRHFFRGRWEAVFVLADPLPHPPTAQRTLERGGPEADRIRDLGDPTSNEYKFRQSRIYRTNRVLTTLFEALAWAKTQAWRNTRNGWIPIAFDQWSEGSEAYRLFIRELQAVIGDGGQSSGDLLIEKAPLDSYIGGVPVPPIDPDLALRERRRPGRPPINLVRLKDELKRYERDHDLPAIERGWRETVCRRLREFHRTHVDQQRVPAVKTLMKNLKLELDRIQGTDG